MKHGQMGSSHQESGLVGLEVREEAVIPLVEKVPEGVLLHQEA